MAMAGWVLEEPDCRAKRFLRASLSEFWQAFVRDCLGGHYQASVRSDSLAERGGFEPSGPFESRLCRDLEAFVILRRQPRPAFGLSEGSLLTCERDARSRPRQTVEVASLALMSSSTELLKRS